MTNALLFDAIVITCEHAGNSVPSEYRSVMSKRRGLLKTHRGYDKGALSVARRLSSWLKVPLHAGKVTRLVVDLNRSAGIQPAALLDKWYWPYRRGVEADIAKRIKRGQRVLHLSVHSFTPVKNGVARKADIGLLYDPDRRLELTICKAWQPLLQELGYKVRLNYPYVGWSDGFTTHLRKVFPAALYAGVEIEMNQKLARNAKSLGRYAEALFATLQDLT